MKGVYLSFVVADEIDDELLREAVDFLVRNRVPPTDGWTEAHEQVLNAVEAVKLKGFKPLPHWPRKD
jgi:hypothetical protein